jgi:hypothetical protein
MLYRVSTTSEPPVGPRSQCNYPILSYKRLGQAPSQGRTKKGKLGQGRLEQYNSSSPMDVGYYAPAARTT